MTDRELIKALRGEAVTLCHITDYLPETADRLEVLLAENERLKAGKDTNVSTKWHLGTECPPMEKIEDPEDEWWESDRAIVVTQNGVITVATAWKINGEIGWTDEVEQKSVAVKMWMQPEPPCTEGVE